MNIEFLEVIDLERLSVDLPAELLKDLDNKIKSDLGVSGVRNEVVRILIKDYVRSRKSIKSYAAYKEDKYKMRSIGRPKRE